MPLSGFFINLFDEETLSLYLDRGVYAFHMRPERIIGSRSRHYQALADYSCARDGTHVFFFLKRHIVYGGQIAGPSAYGAFFLNGNNSPLGFKADAPLVWDESNRTRYKPTGEQGVFTRPALTEPANQDKVCQPYIIRFEDKLGLVGRTILSDDLYFELGDCPYPLPTNSVQGMSFCTMTPFEVRTALNLIKNFSTSKVNIASTETVQLKTNPVPFTPELGISTLQSAQNEAHLEASILANPTFLPDWLHPGNATLCRQVPMSPFKPSQMDRADICYYSDSEIRHGSIPNTVIELKTGKARSQEADQVLRYIKWLDRRLGQDSSKIRFVLMAQECDLREWVVDSKYETRIYPCSFGNGA